MLTSFKKIASGIYLEGLAIDYKTDTVWYSDVIGGGIHGIRADGSVQSFNQDRLWTGGIMMNADGSVLSSGRGGIMWHNPQSGVSGWLLHEIDGRTVNGINEMTPDGEGGIFFGTCDIENVELNRQPGPTSIYRLTADGQVIMLAEDIGFANGIMYDSKRNVLYCNDTFKGTWAFDVNPDKTLTNRRLLLEKQDADGMALDAEGNVLLTGFRSGSITRLSPAGTELPLLETPADAITQVRFGGTDMCDVYITAIPGDGGDSIKDGVKMTAQNSFLYRARSEIPGKPIEPARFNLG